MSKYTAGQVEALITAAEYIDSEDGDPYLDYAEAAEISGALRWLAATMRQQAERGDGAVSAWREEWAGSDPGRGWYIRESTGINGRVVAYLGENIASELVREVIAAHNASLFIGKPEECADACPPQQVCDYCQAVAPLLRAPAEQGGHKSELAKNLANALVDPSKVSSDNTYVRVDCSDAVRAAELLRTIPAEQGGRVDGGLHFSDAEDVAQWLYRSGQHNAAATVRNQLDVRNERIRELQAALAQNVQGDDRAVVLMSITDEVTPVLQPLEGWRDLPNGNYRLYTHAERVMVPDRELLRRIVDAAWGEATESEQVPSVKWADKIIDSALAAPSQPEDAESDVLARRLYTKWADDQGIHCNRMPGWLELSDAERNEWRTKATTKPEDAA